MARERSDRERKLGWPEAEGEEVPPSGKPTTGGSAPGGAPTGLQHRTDMTGVGGRVPSGCGGDVTRGPSATEAIPEGDVTGGARPSSAVGGSGVGAGGLATGPAGIGGTRNLANGAGRPAGAYGTAPSEPTQTSEEDVVGEANAAEQGLRPGPADLESDLGGSTTFQGTQTGRP
jgi:hypothetical protein